MKTINSSMQIKNKNNIKIIKKQLKINENLQKTIKMKKK